MGEEDTVRQALNVARMRLLGATVIPVTDRQPHPQGRHQRGDARLGHQRRHHALLHRIGHGSASVPDDGARLPAGDRRRGPGPDARADRPAAGRDRRLRRRRLQRDGHLLAVHRRRRRAAARLRGRGRRDRDRPARGHGRRRLGRRHPRHAHVPAAGRRRPDPATHSISAGLDYPGVGPEHAWLHDQARAEYLPVDDAAAMRRVPHPGRDRGHPAGHRERPRHRGSARPGRRR